MSLNFSISSHRIRAQNVPLSLEQGKEKTGRRRSADVSVSTKSMVQSVRSRPKALSQGHIASTHGNKFPSEEAAKPMEKSVVQSLKKQKVEALKQKLGKDHPLVQQDDYLEKIVNHNRDWKKGSKDPDKETLYYENFGAVFERSLGDMDISLNRKQMKSAIGLFENENVKHVLMDNFGLIEHSPDVEELKKQLGNDHPLAKHGDFLQEIVDFNAWEKSDSSEHTEVFFNKINLTGSFNRYFNNYHITLTPEQKRAAIDLINNENAKRVLMFDFGVEKVEKFSTFVTGFNAVYPEKREIFPVGYSDHLQRFLDHTKNLPYDQKIKILDLINNTHVKQDLKDRFDLQQKLPANHPLFKEGRSLGFIININNHYPKKLSKKDKHFDGNDELFRDYILEDPNKQKLTDEQKRAAIMLIENEDFKAALMKKYNFS